MEPSAAGLAAPSRPAVSRMPVWVHSVAPSLAEYAIKLVVDGDDEDPVADHGGCGPNRPRHAGTPGDGAALRVERQQFTDSRSWRAGGHRRRRRRRPRAPPNSFSRSTLVRQICLPVAGSKAVSFIVGIERVDPAVSHHGPGEQPGIAGRAGADIRPPDLTRLSGQGQSAPSRDPDCHPPAAMTRCHLSRQFDPQVGQPGIRLKLTFQTQHRNPLPRQGRRFAVTKPASPAAAGKRHGQQTRCQQACGNGPSGPPGGVAQGNFIAARLNKGLQVRWRGCGHRRERQGRSESGRTVCRLSALSPERMARRAVSSRAEWRQGLLSAVSGCKRAVSWPGSPVWT